MLLDIFDPKAPPTPIGIDLGTTHSVVALATDDGPRALVNCDGTALLPSVVYYPPHGTPIVGRVAARKRSTDAERTVASAKRFIGRSDAEARRVPLQTVPFAVPSDEASAKVARYDLQDRQITPLEVSADILRSLKQSAVEQLTNVGGAVITVPAYFDDAQRQATRDAGKLAGLEVLRLLNEPTAAALAYGLDGQLGGTYAVYDLGGGTFDITILALEDGIFQVKSTGGDSALGGDDIDRVLAARMLEAMGATEPAPEVVALALDAARALKHELSEAQTAAAELPAKGGETLRFELTREQLAEIALPFLERTGKVARRALRDAECTAEELDGVILVGGSTRMPAVRAYVAQLFGREPLCSIDPDLVVAYGAALQARSLSGEGDDVLLLDVLPLSLGIETMGGGVDKILPRNVTIPAGARATFTTYADQQTGFEIHVVQGERELAQDCRSLARFSLKGIPPMPAGHARLEIEFRVDENGLLQVEARETTTGKKAEITVQPSYGLSDDEVEDMLIAALEHGEDDLARRRLADARVEAARVILATQKAFATDADLLEASEEKTIRRVLAELEGALAEQLVEPGKLASRIQARTDELGEVTKSWAGRRMDRAIAGALGGRSLTSVQEEVAGSRGVDAIVQEHEQNRASRAQAQGK